MDTLISQMYEPIINTDETKNIDWYQIIIDNSEQNMYLYANCQLIEPYDMQFTNGFELHKIFIQDGEILFCNKKLNRQQLNKMMNYPHFEYNISATRLDFEKMSWNKTKYPTLFIDSNILLSNYELYDFQKYKYEEFDKGWGCGWRSLQNVFSKLFDQQITMDYLYEQLKNKYIINYDRYGFLDGSMIEDLFPVDQVSKIEITSHQILNDTIKYFNSIDFDKCALILIHDGYIVMISDVMGPNIKIIDPHQNPDIKNFIQLENVGDGGIGWSNIYEVIYNNMSIIGIENYDDFLEINTTFFYLIKNI